MSFSTSARGEDTSIFKVKPDGIGYDRWNKMKKEIL